MGAIYIDGEKMVVETLKELPIWLKRFTLLRDLPMAITYDGRILLSLSSC
jgi:hypothetical protein